MPSQKRSENAQIPPLSPKHVRRKSWIREENLGFFGKKFPNEHENDQNNPEPHQKRFPDPFLDLETLFIFLKKTTYISTF